MRVPPVITQWSFSLECSPSLSSKFIRKYLFYTVGVSIHGIFGFFCFQRNTKSAIRRTAPPIAKRGRATIHARIITVPPRASVSKSAINPTPNPMIFPINGTSAQRIGRIEKNAENPINIKRSPHTLSPQVKNIFSVSICENISCAVYVQREMRSNVLFFA